MTFQKLSAMAFAVAIGLSVSACNKTSNDGAVASSSAVKEAAGHSHEGWWCDEHGVPEEVCAQCSAKIAADFKAKGDWCKKHNRPESQCFVCHPEKEAEFAALYEAKTGKQPPKREADSHGQDSKS